MSTIRQSTSRFVAMILGVAVLLLISTVFKEQVARAAAELMDVRIMNLDANGYVAVHEQGTAKVKVMNPSLLVQPQPAVPWHSFTNLYAYELGDSSPLRPLAGPHAGPIAVTHLTLSPLISRQIGPTGIQLEAWVEEEASCTERRFGDGFTRLWQVYIHNPPDQNHADVLVVPFPIPLQAALNRHLFQYHGPLAEHDEIAPGRPAQTADPIFLGELPRFVPMHQLTFEEPKRAAHFR